MKNFVAKAAAYVALLASVVVSAEKSKLGTFDPPSRKAHNTLYLNPTDVEEFDCHNDADDPFMQTMEDFLLHNFCIKGRHQGNKVIVFPDRRILAQTT